MIGRMRKFGPVTSSGIISSCLGKTKWTSEKAARWALANLKRDTGAFDSSVRPYRCPYCRKWHIGHGW